MFRAIPGFPLYEMDKNKNIRHTRSKQEKRAHRGGNSVRLYTPEGKELSRKIEKLFYATYPEHVPGVMVEPYAMYRVIENGDVFSLHDAEVLRPAKTKDGYLQVSLKDEKTGRYRSELVHRLVAKAFLPACADKPDVNHIDGVKDNNALSNLEWCTKSENLIHAVRTGLYATKQRPCRLEKGEQSLDFTSVIEAARFLGVSPGALRCTLERNAAGKKPSRGTPGRYSCKGYIPTYIIQNTLS